MAETYVHSIDAYTLNFAGVLIDGGGGDGGFVEIELPQRFDTKNGVHGDAVSFKTPNTFAPCRITLLQQSSFNEDLMSIHEADKRSESGSGIGTFILEDVNSGLEIQGTARIVQAPTFNIQAEGQEVTWTLHVFQPDVTFRSRAV